jgi:type IV pilus assembly protein PilV
MTHTRIGHCRPRAEGASLVEILVTVFVLGFGILGTSSLQLKAKQANVEARQRASASALAQDLLERMRVNATELATYTDAGVGRTLTGATSAAVSCTSACTTTQLAQHDLYEWEQALAGATERVGATNAGGLPAITACIDGPDGGSGEYRVAIAWRGQVGLSNPGLSDCGAGSGRYESKDGTGVDVHRRVLVVDTYIMVPI